MSHGEPALRIVVNLRSAYDFWDFAERHRSALAMRFPDATFHTVEQPGRPDPGLLAQADVYFGWRFDPRWFAIARRLRWIASPAAGVDHLPLAEAEEHQVTVTRSFGFHGQPMAEHALALLSAFSRGLFLSRDRQRTAGWWKDEIAASFFDLEGSTLAIVGCGHIGCVVAQRARAQGMHVLGVRRNPPVSDTGVEWVHAADVDGALRRSHAVLDLLPKTRATTRFFSRDRFAAMRRHAVFLNLGRASTVDEDALLEAVNSGQIAWAGLDVVEEKPPRPDHPFRHHPRIVLTPKSAVFSHQYMDRAVEFFAENLRRYLACLPLRGHVAGPDRPPGRTGMESP